MTSREPGSAPETERAREALEALDFLADMVGDHVPNPFDQAHAQVAIGLIRAALGATAPQPTAMLEIRDGRVYMLWAKEGSRGLPDGVYPLSRNPAVPVAPSEPEGRVPFFLPDTRYHVEMVQREVTPERLQRAAETVTDRFGIARPALLDVEGLAYAICWNVDTANIDTAPAMVMALIRGFLAGERGATGEGNEDG